MFIAQNYNLENKFFKYLLGSLIIFIASIVGQIPLGIAVIFKTIGNTGKIPSNESDLYQMFDSNLFLFLILISFVFAFGALYLVVRKIHYQEFIKVITTRERVDWKRFFLAFGLWALITITLVLVSYAIDSTEIKVQFNLVPFLILCLITLLLIPIQTSTEELVFRGYLMQGFYQLSKNKWFPLAMTSVIFGVMHIFNPEVQKMGNIVLIYYVGTGFFLGIITLMDEGTELALGFHAANNMISALLITADYTVFKTHSIFKDFSEPALGFDILLPILFYFLMILLFAKIYKWENWKEKLVG